MSRGVYDLEDKSSKLYSKVLNYYNKGMLEKALDLCEENEDAIQAEPAFLNLVGLMHYVKGEMNEARRCWNLNYKKYGDVVSEKYLLDSKNDEELWKCYVKGVKQARALNITGAILELERCRMKSGFNSINVNNQLTKCYMQKSNYEEAIKCMEDVLAMDKYNKEAKENRKILMELNIIKSHKRKVFLYVAASVVILVSVLSAGITVAVRNNKNKVMSSQDQISKLQQQMDKNKEHEASEDSDKNGEADKKGNEENEPHATGENHENSKFPSEKMQSYLENKNYKAIDVELSKWQDENNSLGINEKTILSKCKNFMDSNAGEYFYNEGYSLSKNGNYKEAIEYYKTGIKYGKGQFPYEHALYMLGVAYNKVSDYENSIRTFETYFEEYKSKTYIKDDSYIVDVLRYLKDMTKDIDQGRYKKYSAELEKVV